MVSKFQSFRKFDTLHPEVHACPIPIFVITNEPRSPKHDSLSECLVMFTRLC